MKPNLFSLLLLVGIVVCLGCQKKAENKTESGQVETQIYLFKEMLNSSEKRNFSLKSEEPIQIWTGVEFDEEDIKKVPDGGYMGALLTNRDTFRSVAGTSAATTFYPQKGIINLEIQNESDLALNTVVFLRGEDAIIYQKYNQTGDDNSE